MLHVKFEIHKCSGFREKIIEMDLKAKVDLNCERKEGRMDQKPDAYFAHKAEKQGRTSILLKIK